MEINRDELELQNEESTKRQTGVRELYLKFRQLYELAPTGYLTLDRDDRIIETNKRAAQIIIMISSHYRCNIFHIQLYSDTETETSFFTGILS